jgi:hypothetical protein
VGEDVLFVFLFIYFLGLKLEYHIIESFQLLCIVIMVIIDSVGFFFWGGWGGEGGAGVFVILGVYISI